MSLPTDRAFARLCALCTVGLSALMPSPQAAAQERGEAMIRERPYVAAGRSDDPPVIDGVLDEAVWAKATVIEDFRVAEPVEGAPLPESTEALVLYDESAIYFGFRCFDRDPDAVIARVLRRDGTQRADDRIMIMLDPFNERRSGYAFSVNPNGARWDGLLEEGGGVRPEWDGIWYAAAHRTEDGWVAEVAIPTKTLNFPKGGSTWGLNLARTIVRMNQVGRWAYPLPNVFFLDVSRFGEMGGLEGLEQGLGLDVVPAVALRQKRDNDEGRVTDEGDPSLDLFYKITPSLTNVLTVNTDFSDAEPDERQANLTRFSLFFPEQRDFFLQDSGIFQFADFGPRGPGRPRQKVNGQPFFSRRIGIEEEGGPLSIRFGEKLTGRIGRVNVGMLSTRVESFDDVDGKWLSVARAFANVLEESTVGAMMTYGHPTENEHNKLFGTDFNYRTSRLFGDKILQGSLSVQKTSSSGRDDKEAAFGASIAYPNDKWNWNASALEIQENFNPALGFANRVAIRDYRGNIRHRWRPGTNIRTVDTALQWRLVTGTDNDFQTLILEFDPLRIDSEEGDFLGFRLRYLREDLLEDFEIREGIVIPEENYRFDRYRMRFRSSRNRPILVGLDLEYGHFFSGTRFDVEVEARWRPSPHTSLGIEYEQFQVRLPEGNFTTRIARVNLDFAFSAALSWTNLIQWDNETDDLTLASRLRWIVEPGRELILVFDPSFRREDRFRLTSTTTEMVFKLLWTYRF